MRRINSECLGVVIGVWFLLGILPGTQTVARAFFYIAEAKTQTGYDTIIKNHGLEGGVEIREDTGNMNADVTSSKAPSESLPVDLESQPVFKTENDTYYHAIGSGQPTVVEGFGDRVELRQALFLLMPEQWEANTEFVPPMRVTWSGPKPWTEILRQFAREKRLRITVNWNHKQITVEPLEGQPLVIAAGEMLSQGLDRWARRSGWTLAWEASRDYPVAVTTVFSEGFVDSVRHLSRTLWEHGVPLKMTLYKGNKVLGVEVSKEVLNFEN